MSADIKFYEGVQSEYNKLGSKQDPNGIYFLSDTRTIVKNNVKYDGGDPKVATSSSVGVVKPDDSFNISSDGTLSVYKAISINSFVNSTGIVEKGSSVSNSTFSWNLNKIPQTLTIAANGQTTQLSEKQSSSMAVSFNTPITTTTSFTLTALDEKKHTATAMSSIYFYNGVYCGVSDSNNIDSKFILGLTKTLKNNATGTYTVNAEKNQYIYFAIPANYETPHFYVGGFEGGLNLVKTFDFTNASGYTESYNVYKSTNMNLGQTAMEEK